MVNPSQGFNSIGNSTSLPFQGQAPDIPKKPLPPKLEKPGSSKTDLPKQVRSPNQSKVSDSDLHKRSIKNSSEKPLRTEKQSFRDLKPIRADSRRLQEHTLR
mmetsp:Transcript_12731/g.19739  ORF Transcript_12731/g.19739 Transcript_12731/m.19739 type:complete len:102 (+) Transcript_12731:1347-1652(+)